MKKILATVLAVTLLMGAMAGCAAQQPEPEPTITPMPTEQPTPQPTQAPTPEPTAEPTPEVPGQVFTEPTYVEGYSVTTGRASDKPYKPVAVMIPNGSDGYPQTGLNRADIVYEMTVEGGITRFMAIFNDDMPEKVGPIRSCRIYFADTVRGFDALLAHFGGPDQAEAGEAHVYRKFEAVGVKQREDGYKGSTLMYRDSSVHAAPNNVYTDLREIQARYKYEPEAHLFNFDCYNAHEYADAPAVTRVDFTYIESNRLAYVWDAENARYVRWRNDSKAYDAATNESLTAVNVIFQYAEHVSMNDPSGHINIKLIGQGDFEALVGGRLVKGTWRKDSAASPTQFLLEDGTHLCLEPGNTYIQVLPIGREVTYTYAGE